LILKKIEVGPFSTNCYLVGCPKTLEGVVIDPGGDGKRLIKEITDLGLTIKYIINTHGHGDHILANKDLKESTNALLLIHELDEDFLVNPQKNLMGLFGKILKGIPADQLLKDGDQISFGNKITFNVIHTPGHTPGGICLDSGEHLFTGDTLFAGSIGRTDFPGGSYQDLISSITTKLFTLAGDRQVWPGHGPGSTLDYEKNHNPFF